MLFLWLKAFHVFFVIAWFAGIFYLPRIFVHHSLSTDSNTHERLDIMARKLYKFTLVIAHLAIFTGIALVVANHEYFLKQGWLHAKITLALGLFGFHFYCGNLAKKLARGENPHSTKFYRIINEAPVLVLLGIVILVIVRPF
ncbi:MAG: CopD family protein [Cellvibrionales bacterium]|nr:CopD family protein [Cellvibrionales bacterium]